MGDHRTISARLAALVPHLYVCMPPERSDGRGLVVSVALDGARFSPATNPARVHSSDTNRFRFRCIGATPSGRLAFAATWWSKDFVLVNPITGVRQSIDVGVSPLPRRVLVAGDSLFAVEGNGLDLILWRQAPGSGEERSWSRTRCALHQHPIKPILSAVNCNGCYYLLHVDGSLSTVDATAPPPLRMEKLPVARPMDPFHAEVMSQLAMSATEVLNSMDNQNHMTIEVDNQVYQVYHMPDMVPKPRNNSNAAKGTRSQRTCFYCRNPGHKIANCPYYEPVNETKSTGTNMKNEVPHAPVPFIGVQSEVPEKHQEQEAQNNMDGTYPKSPSGVTSILERMNALKGSLKKVRKEVTNLTKTLQLTNTRDKYNQKRKNNSQVGGQATFGMLKKPRNTVKGHAFHQPNNVHEGSSGATLPPKVDRRVARTSRTCFACHKRGHLIADCPEFPGHKQ
ncbi:hypothetical protein EJB05_24381, partial [Eragrostis curvula]